MRKRLENEMPQFSIIVPVYNTLEYLKACLTSVLFQNYQDLEVIVVNDGSSDDSHILLEYYSKNYPGITLIHQENHGLSHSRNVGLAKATGEYVLFLDSDDALIPNSLQGLAQFLDQSQPDVCVYNWMSFYNGKTIEYYEYFAHKKLKKMKAQSGRDFIYEMLQKDKYWELYAWNMAYKKSYLDQKGFQFVEGILFEDMIWNWQVLLEAKLVNYYPFHILLYTRKREGQITRDISLKSVLSRVKVSNYWLNHIDRYNLTQNERYHFLVRISNLYLSGIIMVGALDAHEQEIVFDELEKGKEILRYAPNAFVQSCHSLLGSLGFRRVAKLIGKKSRVFFQL